VIHRRKIKANVAPTITENKTRIGLSPVELARARRQDYFSITYQRESSTLNTRQPKARKLLEHKQDASRPE